ncbi:MAG UNVERIFIED_CONTAM: hypothetical protein LVQ98_01580 [Rickettsiaceae bacterium]
MRFLFNLIDPYKNMYKSLLDYVIMNLFRKNLLIKRSFEWDEDKNQLNFLKHGVSLI